MTDGPTPVVLDVDPGCDDAVLLALALASEEVRVEGVTTVAGNAPLADTTRNALAILERLGRPDVPVVAGCDRPLVGEVETAEHVHGEGGLPEAIQTPSTDPTAGHAATFLRERAESVEDLTVVATGPLTNVAVALAMEPAFAESVDLAVMGGALDVPGNATAAAEFNVYADPEAAVPGNATAAAEFNVYADPEAASRVVRDAHPRIVGLDVTERATLPAPQVESLLDRPEPLRTIAGWLAYETPATLDRRGVTTELPLHDPAVLIDLVADVLSYETGDFVVAHGDGEDRGALRRASEGKDGGPAAVATDIDVAVFRATMTDLLDRLE